MNRRLVVLETNCAGNGLRLGRVARQIGFDVVFVTDRLAKYDRSQLQLVFGDSIVELNYWDLNASHSWFLSFAPEQIVAFDDFHVLIANVHAQTLGIDANALRSLFLCLDKGACRVHLDDTSLRHLNPPFAILPAGERVQLDRPFVAYPAVIKPSMESGSLAVAQVSSADKLPDALAKVRSQLHRSPTTAAQPLLIESYMSGREFSVEIFADADGDWHALGVCETFTGQNFVEIGHTLPARVSQEDFELLSTAACRVATQLGLSSGLAHVELKLTHDGVRLVEINPRNAGDFIPELYDLVYREYFLERALLTRVADPTPARGAAHIRFLMPSGQGRVSRIIFPTDRTIVETSTRSLPAAVGPPSSSDDRLGHIIVVGDDAGQAESRAAEMIARTKVEIN